MAPPREAAGFKTRMNYETTVELSGTPEALMEEIDIDTRRTRRRRVIAAVLIVVALLVLAAWMLSSGGGEESALAPAEEATVPAVTVVAPGSGTIEGVIHATGTLAARHLIEVGVVGEGGRVVSVPVEAGDWVRQGQVLAVIDRSVQNQQAQSAAAQIQVARADANLAQANLDRALKLVERGFISKADVDRLTATRDAAVARVRVAEAQHRELLARNARLNIIAPSSGLILERNVEIGQVIGAGSEAPFTMAQGGQMELLARLSEDDLASVSVGSSAVVTPSGSQKSFVGQIWQAAPVIDPEDRQGTARVALAYDPALRPGGFASAEINSGTVVAPRLPESAILSDAQGSFVYVVNKDNRVERRAVRTGMVSAEGIAVIAGLTGRERIVMRAGGFLNPGDRVRPVLEGKGRQVAAR
jgi:RND family efflux transporter MFP subunit